MKEPKTKALKIEIKHEQRTENKKELRKKRRTQRIEARLQCKSNEAEVMKELNECTNNEG